MPTSTLRILIVDDNADSGDSLGTLLRLRGNTVRVVYTGSAALSVAPRFRPDVVLLDIGMPGVHGYEVCARLREMESVRHAAIFAVTGWVQAADFAKAKAAGFDEHLGKPVILHDLLEKMEQYAPKERLKQSSAKPARPRSLSSHKTTS